MHVIHIVPTYPGEKVHRMTGTQQWPHFNGAMLHRVVGFAKDRLCHYRIKHGRIHYGSDCTHDYAGRTVDLPDFQIQRPEGASYEEIEAKSTEADDGGIEESSGQSKDAEAAPAVSAEETRRTSLKVISTFP